MISVYVLPVEYEQLKKEADSEERSLGGHVRWLIRRHLNGEKR
jgi:hypothetical protein